MSRLATLLGQRLRRDGVQLAVWIAATALLTYGSSVGVVDAFGTDEERRTLLALALANPAILLFRGLPSGAGLGAFLIFTILPFLVLLAALMAGFLAVRHTRAEEETGRAELLSATPAGRRLPFVATVVHGVIACALIGAGVGVALVASGLDAFGAVTSAAAVATAGTVFLAVGLVAAQLFRSSRAANSLTVAVIVTSFLIGGIGNALGIPSDDLARMESSPLAWLSPFVWAENVRAYADDDPLPLLLAIGVAVALLATAAVLQGLRDVGSGVFAPRPGRADASPLLSSPFGLAWRLSAGSLVAWTVGAVVIGVLSTSLGSVIGELATENPSVAAILQQMAAQGSMDQGLLVTFFVMIGVLAACFGVQTVQRARHEETSGTAEPTLAGAIDRSVWLSGFLAVALIGIVVMGAAAVVGAEVALAASGGDTSLLDDAVVAGAEQVAAASVLTVLTALVFTIVPRATVVLGWGLVLASASLALFGTLLDLDENVVRLSPFAATPVPAGDGVDLNGTWWLVTVAVAGASAALILMRRRELAAAG